ncbi:hypothetical protein FRB98_001673 [Tulasnella sp. 332]|nr:hypothetical protein FRB98_001673 [Tulasnella sp. 332]
MNSVRVDKEVMIGSIQGGTTVGHAQVELLKPGRHGRSNRYAGNTMPGNTIISPSLDTD